MSSRFVGPEWNDRFTLKQDLRNERVNPEFKLGNARYYRVHRSGLPNSHSFVKKLKDMRIPVTSSAFDINNVMAERMWDANLTKFSKNNPTLPKYIREYFEEEVKYDIRGLP